MNKSSKVNPLKKAFWQAFSLTAFLLFVSQKIDELRQKTPKGIEIANHAPVPLYWASEEKTSPVENFAYQEIHPAPFMYVEMNYLDFLPSSPYFEEISAWEFDQRVYSKEISPPPNWQLLNVGTSTSQVILPGSGIGGGGCMMGMN